MAWSWKTRVEQQLAYGPKGKTDLAPWTWHIASSTVTFVQFQLSGTQKGDHHLPCKRSRRELLRTTVACGKLCTGPRELNATLGRVYDSKKGQAREVKGVHRPSPANDSGLKTAKVVRKHRQVDDTDEMDAMVDRRLMSFSPPLQQGTLDFLEKA